jgi:hypothetical protein
MLVICRNCGETITSQAEVDFIRRHIGYPGWLDYCSYFRTRFIWGTDMNFPREIPHVSVSSSADQYSWTGKNNG